MKQAFEKLDEKLSEKGVCVAVKAKLSKDSGVGKGIDFDHIVEKLQDKPKAKGKNIVSFRDIFIEKTHSLIFWYLINDITYKYSYIIVSIVL